MLLWFLFAAMTAGVLAAVLYPLNRPAREASGAGVGARAVLRHQLEEIEAERARGMLADSEAAAARIELSRRALADTSAAAARTATPQPMPPRGSLAMAIAVALPLLSLAIYLARGSPQMASPVAERASLERADIGTLVAQVEARLRERPDDGQGWDVIAPIYLKLGRFRDAADAFAHAARLQGESVRRLTGYAEATVLAANGRVVEETRRAAEKILNLAPGSIEARYWLALGKEQDGKLAQALADYQGLLKDTPDDAEDWRHALAERISGVAARLGGKSGDKTPPGPGEQDVLAASKLSPSERETFIAGMVNGLAERLKRDGGDLAGWQRLINAYAVLGRDHDARRALEDARKQFAADGHALAALNALAKKLGLGS